MLFSEPKIPQFVRTSTDRRAPTSRRFSALQRAENSSIHTARRSASRRWKVSVLFSEPKIPQSIACCDALAYYCRFSALQRAENSSICDRRPQKLKHRRFQCSSASRKFLNSDGNAVGRDEDEVSVLFSEPKIPQSRVV